MTAEYGGGGGGGGAGVLTAVEMASGAGAVYNPANATTLTAPSSSLRATFTAPPSGQAIVLVSGVRDVGDHSGNGNEHLLLALLNIGTSSQIGNSQVLNQEVSVTIAQEEYRCGAAAFVLTGLAPSTSYTISPGYIAQANTSTAIVTVGSSLAATNVIVFRA